MMLIRPDGPASVTRLMSRRPDPVLAQRRREALIRAGYAEILEKGVPNLTIDGVVARAQTSKGGALYYFSTRDDLLYAILEWLLAELNHTLDDIAQSDAPPRAQLSSEIEVLFHSAEVNRKLYRVLFDYVALASRTDRYRLLVNRFFETCARRDAEMIEEGIRRREFRRVDPVAAASTLRALVDGYCMQWLMASEESTLEVYRERCKAVFSSYLRIV